MGIFAFVPLFIVLFTILVWSLISKKARRDPISLWILIMGLIGLVTIIRLIALANHFQLLEIYALVFVGISYLISFILAVFFYKDPVREGFKKGGDAKPGNKVRIHYVIPVHNEEIFIARCINSVLNAAEFASGLATVRITIVDDASTDDGKTAQAIALFKGLPNVRIISLKKNAGKKGALAAGTAGGENWREGFEIFQSNFGRLPTKSDTNVLGACFTQADCDFWPADYYFYTDSDSVVGKQFIAYMVWGFFSNPKIGAISGHCNVWRGGEKTFLTNIQVAWYDTQFSIRKAAESAFGAVFCVSGPGAGFRREALLHNLLPWVDDEFGGKIYRGATDRKLTLLVLQDKFRVEYSEIAKVETVVPSNFEEARSQWTRWKQNFWRMFMPVWQFAWRIHPVIAYMTYTRLVVTVLAPIILAYHLIAFLLGEWLALLIYLAGIAVMGGLMGLAYIVRHPTEYKFALYRMAMSWISAFWGSVLTIGALIRTLNSTFTWREKEVVKKGRLINRWFTPTIEMQFLEVILIILVIIRLIRFFSER